MARLKTEVTFITKHGRTLSKRESFYDNGQLAETGVYAGAPQGWNWSIPAGPIQSFYMNGQLKSVIPYNEKGILHGESLYYDSNGKLIKRIKHANDVMVEEEIFS